MTLRLVLLLLAAAPAVSRADFVGRVSLRVEDVIPFDPPNPSSGRRHHDLLVDLDHRGGAFEKGGWAFIAAMPGIEHAVTVREGRFEKDRIVLKLLVELRHQLPQRIGGTVELFMDLAVDGDELSGEYNATIIGLDDGRRTELWKSLGGKGPHPFQQGVRSGQVQSLTHLARPHVVWGVRDQDPIRATGRLIAGGASAVAATQPMAGGLVNATVRRRAATPDGGKIMEAMRRPAGPTTRESCDGFAAAGAAFLHALTGKTEDAQAAIDAIGRAVSKEPRGHELARQVAGLALAYDLARENWPADLRAKVRQRLLSAARRWTGVDAPRSAADTPFAPGEFLADLDGPYDYRLATARSAAGLALLALRQESEPDMPAMLSIVGRSVGRFLEGGIGPRGAGIGNNGYDEAIELLFPFLQMWRQVTGEDLSTGTGARWTAAWSAMSHGLSFNAADIPADAWLAHSAGLVEPKLAPAIAWYWDRHGLRINHAWDAIFALLNRPEVTPRPPVEVLPLILHDRRMNGFVCRSGWDDPRDFVFLYDMGSGSPRCAPMRGHFSLAGMGRQWVRRTEEPWGRFTWPRTRQCNVLQVLKSEMTRRGDAEFNGGGRLAQVRGRRNGSASLSMVTQGFIEPGVAIDDMDESKSWRTIGVDYGGASGAPALIVLVEGAVGLADRQQVWEIDLGDVPETAVKSAGLRFDVRPSGTKASMAGTVLYPTTAYIEYLPPRDGTTGRLRVHRHKPGERSLEKLMKTLDERLDAQIQAMLKDEDSNIDIRRFDLPLEDPKTELAERLVRQNQTVYLKLLKETSSVKMGGGDRPPKARGSFVIVLTVQAGDAPPVKPLDTTHESLLQVGPQTVLYRENLLEFAK